MAGKNATYGHTETRESLAAEKSCRQSLAERTRRKTGGARGVRHSCLDSRHYPSEVLEVTETGGAPSSEQNQVTLPLQSLVGGVAHSG